GEKFPGEKKKLGALAEQAYEEKRAKGEIEPRPFADDVNCDIDRTTMAPEHTIRLRPSEVLLGAAVLLPAAVTIIRGVRAAAKNNEGTVGTGQTRRGWL
ncbi:MAG: hypothetical protein ABIP65_05320, partial [Vicinamibacterales bacterium]